MLITRNLKPKGCAQVKRCAPGLSPVWYPNESHWLSVIAPSVLVDS